MKFNLEPGLTFKDPERELNFLLKPDQFFLKIGVRVELVTEVLNDIDKYYASYQKKKKFKDGTQKLKKGVPQVRLIDPSVSDLKWIQERISKRIFRKFEYPINIQGGLKKRDNIRNAKLHLGKKFHLCSDLSNFFPSVTHKYVYNRLVQIGFSADVSRIITKLCTYKGRIPQGVSTSTHLTNLVFYPLDIRIIEYCNKYNLFYSRFVDDIAISSSHNFKHQVNTILDFINTSDFKINQSKTKYSVGKAEITGILVSNNVLNPKNSLVQKYLAETVPNKKTQLRKYIRRIKKA